MKSNQLNRFKNQGWSFLDENQQLTNPLILVFGNRMLLETIDVFQELRELFPDGHIVIGSTSGDITPTYVDDTGITATAIEFEKSDFLIKTTNLLTSKQDSFKTGNNLIDQFPQENLKSIFVLSEGSFVNGSHLTKGISEKLEEQVLVTGGLCGDSDRFQKTIAGYNESPKEGEIIAIGFYGESLEVSFSLYGGWTPFGPERIVTKSKDNVLYELDDKPALDLYKKYLGEKSKELPSAALLYPLNVRIKQENQSIVRTILNIDNDKKGMILAGDIPEGSKVQLMMTNVDNIANASEKAIQSANKNRENKAELAIVVSCIGRKLVLDQRVEEEIEEVVNVLDDDATICGFYSYGEIAPFNGENSCKLHNQTITITLISEI